MDSLAVTHTKFNSGIVQNYKQRKHGQHNTREEINYEHSPSELILPTDCKIPSEMHHTQGIKKSFIAPKAFYCVDEFLADNWETDPVVGSGVNSRMSGMYECGWCMFE